MFEWGNRAVCPEDVRNAEAIYTSCWEAAGAAGCESPIIRATLIEDVSAPDSPKLIEISSHQSEHVYHDPHSGPGIVVVMSSFVIKLLIFQRRGVNFSQT